jgi:hypothetical protein
MKVCKICGARKRASAFWARRGRCRACLRALDQARIEASRRWIEAYARKWRRAAGRVVDRAVAFSDGRPSGRRMKSDSPPSPYYQLRHDAIMAYGGYRCACCAETDPVFLTLDHINGDGARHRRRVGAGNGLLAWLRKRSYPPGFQVLCWNCNVGRHRNGGDCPHKKRKNKRCVGRGVGTSRSTRRRRTSDQSQG